MKSLAQECRGKLNHICIAWDGTMGRLVGIRHDAMDAYYHLRVRDRDTTPARGNDRYVTMVTGCDSLAELPVHRHLDADYTRDGCPPVDEMIEVTDSRAQDIASYGHTSVDNGFGYDDRIILSPDRSFPTDIQPHLWLLVRRAGYDDDTVIGLEEHDEKGFVVLDAPADGDWEALILARVMAGMRRMATI